jgi:hypothetical protein
VGELVFVAVEDVGGLHHPAGALGESCLLLSLEGADRQLELLLDQRRGKRLKGLEYFAGGGVRCRNGHKNGSFGM